MAHYFYKTRNPVLETLGQIAMIASLVVAILYPFNILPFNPIFVKGSAVGLLALYTLFRVRAFDHVLLIIVLAANAIGDMQLAQNTEEAMLEAMRSFMAGHILLTLIFLRNRTSVYDLSSGRVTGAALLWAFAGMSLVFLWPNLGADRTDILIYTGALIAMATAGLFSRYNLRMVGYGALLYVISDSLIAADTFLLDMSWLGPVTWGLYYIGQLLITAGVLLAADKDKSFPIR